MVMKTKLFLTAAALMVLTALASAQDKAVNQNQQNVTTRGVQYVDANNDGICDNFEARRSGNFKGRGQGYMSGGRQGQRMGMGMGPCGMGQGRGKGMNYVDANKNGICDFRETPAKK